MCIIHFVQEYKFAVIQEYNNNFPIELESGVWRCLQCIYGPQFSIISRVEKKG